MQYRPIDELYSDQHNATSYTSGHWNGNIHDRNYDGTLTPYGKTDTFESDWYGDVDDCSNDDTNTSQNRRNRNDPYINNREELAQQRRKTRIITKPVSQRRNSYLKRPAQRFADQTQERDIQPTTSRSTGDGRDTVRSLQMQLRKALGTIQTYSFENDVLQKQLHSSLESADVSQFGDPDVSSLKCTDISKFRGTIATQQITIDNLITEKKNLQAALSKQTTNLLIEPTREYSKYNSGEHSSARSSTSEASSDPIPSSDISQNNLAAHVEHLTDLLERGKEYQHTLLNDLNRSKRLNKHLRSTVKCLEKSTAIVEEEKKTMQGKFRQQLITSRRSSSRRVSSAGFSRGDRAMEKRGEEGVKPLRNGDAQVDPGPCLIKSERMVPLLTHIESEMALAVRTAVEIPTLLTSHLVSTTDVAVEQEELTLMSSVLALKVSLLGLADSGENGDGDKEPDCREDIFEISEGPCRSCTMYVNSLQQKLQRQKRIHEREVRNLRSVSASPMHSARGDSNSHFFPSMPNTPAASFRGEWRNPSSIVCVAATDVSAATFVPVVSGPTAITSTASDAVTIPTSPSLSGGDASGETDDTCIADLSQDSVSVPSSTSTSEQGSGTACVLPADLSSADFITTKFATDIVAAAVNTARGRVTFAAPGVVFLPVHTPKRAILRSPRLPMSPQLPTSPKGSKPPAGSSSRVIKLKEERVEKGKPSG